MSDQRSQVNASRSVSREAFPSRSPGRLFILSAPSGAGKSTLCALLRERLPALQYSVSYTTRPPRTGEKDGIDYFFIDTFAFEDGIDKGRWIEWARVHGQYYGTSAAYVDRLLAQGADLLLDIDVQGAAQLVDKYPHAVTIFIMPPSMEILRRRLENRDTDSAEDIAGRLENARQEMAARFRYDHIVVNDGLEQAVDDLVDILTRAYKRAPGGDRSLSENG
jgi:guanylate kinase